MCLFKKNRCDLCVQRILFLDDSARTLLVGDIELFGASLMKVLRISFTLKKTEKYMALKAGISIREETTVY